MPHVNIKFFPVPIDGDKEATLVADITKAVQNALGCDENVISIALEPVEQASWNDRVYQPEIVARKDLLAKVPNY